MDLKLVTITNKEKEILQNLMQLYQYELSILQDDNVHIELNEKCLFEYKYLDNYINEETRYPYLLKCNKEIGGFILARQIKENEYEISEFFVLPKYRKSKVGTFMANEIFDKYKGKWEIRTIIKNKAAQNFWRKTIKDYTNNNFEEKYIRNNTRYAFYFNN